MTGMAQPIGGRPIYYESNPLNAASSSTLSPWEDLDFFNQWDDPKGSALLSYLNKYSVNLQAWEDALPQGDKRRDLVDKMKFFLNSVIRELGKPNPDRVFVLQELFGGPGYSPLENPSPPLKAPVANSVAGLAYQLEHWQT